MGFINGNTNSFEVFFTDLGLQAFYKNGIKDDALFFSVSDDDANYSVFTSSTYNPYNVVNNPNVVIPSIELDTTINRTINNQHRVFTQTNKRGNVINGKTFESNFVNGDGSVISKASKFSLLKTNESTLKNYVPYEGDLNTQELKLLTYRKLNGIKQFNIKGVNGLYLSYPTDLYSNKIIDSNAYPQNVTDIDFIYTNSNINITTGTTGTEDYKFYFGSNDKSNMNQIVANSSIVRSGYLIQNETYNITFDFQFTFNNPKYTNKPIRVNLYVILGKNKIPVSIFTPGDNASTTTKKNNAISVIDGTSLDTSVVKIDNNSSLLITNNIPVEGLVYCSLPVDVMNLCKKGKDLTIFVDYNGTYGGEIVASPIFGFKIMNLSTNFYGVSVSNSIVSSTTTPPTITYNQYTSTTDKLYVLNKNTKSVKFNDIKFKDAVLRNRNLTSVDKNLIVTKTNVSKDVNDLVKISQTFSFQNQIIGVLVISYPYSYSIKENVLIMPFQSFPISAQYTVLDPGGFFVDHYYGQSLAEPKKRTGMLDVNFTVNCVSLEGLPINEDITVSVNLINGGFILPVKPPINPTECTYKGVYGTFIKWVQSIDCNRKGMYADGNCGFYYGVDIPDNTYCATPTTTTTTTKSTGTFVISNSYNSYITNVIGNSLPPLTYTNTNDKTYSNFTNPIPAQSLKVTVDTNMTAYQLHISLLVNNESVYCVEISGSGDYHLSIPQMVYIPSEIRISIGGGHC